MPRFFFLASILLLSLSLKADIRLPAVIGSHMVLQQNAESVIWGWGAPAETVTLTADWLPGQEYKVAAGRTNLQWAISIPVPRADNKPHTITIKGGWANITLTDIYFGEVWLCSGQSNMEWQPAWGNVQITEAQYAAANDSLLRFFTVPRNSLPSETDDCRSEWLRSTRETMTRFSATAYFFARELRNELGVPVGIINASWGGTPVESWIPEKALSGEALELTTREDHPVYHYGRAGSLYNGMIGPVKKFRIKGMLWYQGETNTYNPHLYADLQAMMVNEWRKDFGQNCPFYYVQIAPFRYGRPFEGALLREQQLKALRKIPNSGMVVVSDIGNIEDIHPGNKTDVGKRLAAWALANTYGQFKRPVSGPLYREFTVEKKRIRVHFDYADKGLRSRDGQALNLFEIAGEDRVFHPAVATIEDSDVLVASPDVPRPVAVRFAFSNTAEPNLMNVDGLPASCFRTDDWVVEMK